MAQLTEEQVDRAAIAGSRVAAELGYPQRLSISTPQEEKEMAHKIMRAAAPFLQLPWEEPNPDELAEIERMRWHWDAGHHKVADTIRFVAGQLVNLRNAALLANTIDPRRDKIIETLRAQRKDEWYEVIADNILNALDKVK